LLSSVLFTQNGHQIPLVISLSGVSNVLIHLLQSNLYFLFRFLTIALEKKNMAQTSKSKSFTNLNLTDVKLVDVQLYNVNLDDAKFENGKLVGAGFIKAKIIKSSSVFGISNSNNEEEMAEKDEDVAISSNRNQERVARKESSRKELQERVDEPTKIKVARKEEKEESRTENKPEKKDLSKRYQNLGKIDEKKLADRVSALNANRKFNKGNFFFC
jgi:hypothetical protein